MKKGDATRPADQLKQVLAVFLNDFANIGDGLSGVKLAEDKWSLKEIIGHLIDSASNNHQRFIRLQLVASLDFPDYRNTEWLDIARYGKMKYEDLFNLFLHYNRLLAHIISNVEKKDLNNKWNIKWNDAPCMTLGELIDHYIEHLQGHLTHFRDRFAELKAASGRS